MMWGDPPHTNPAGATLALEDLPWVHLAEPNLHYPILR
jgi:hypothetical protein